jgi:hypothetical protein
MPPSQLSSSVLILLDTAGAVERLPDLPPKTNEENLAEVRTGTDDQTPATTSSKVCSKSSGPPVRFGRFQAGQPDIDDSAYQSRRGRASDQNSRIPEDLRRKEKAAEDDPQPCELVGATGLEPAQSPFVAKDLRQSIIEKSRKNPNPNYEMPPDLAQVVAVWPNLPEAVRTAIMPLTETVNKGTPSHSSRLASGPFRGLCVSGSSYHNRS